MLSFCFLKISPPHLLELSFLAFRPHLCHAKLCRTFPLHSFHNLRSFIYGRCWWRTLNHSSCFVFCDFHLCFHLHTFVILLRKKKTTVNFLHLCNFVCFWFCLPCSPLLFQKKNLRHAVSPLRRRELKVILVSRSLVSHSDRKRWSCCSRCSSFLNVDQVESGLFSVSFQDKKKGGRQATRTSSGYVCLDFCFACSQSDD